MTKKVLFGILLIAVVAAVVFLTFQGPGETMSLSESVRGWALLLGYKGDLHQFRSEFHYVEYFAVGFAAAMFFKSMNWKKWTAGALGCVIGILDETVKIFLPTREFDILDLLRDFVGVWMAVMVVWLIYKKKEN